MTIVDTAVWSLLLRRKPENLNAREAQLTDELGFLIAEGRAGLLGVVRQELLSGMSDAAQYARLRAYLGPFADILRPTTTSVLLSTPTCAAGAAYKVHRWIF